MNTFKATCYQGTVDDHDYKVMDCKDGWYIIRKPTSALWGCSPTVSTAHYNGTWTALLNTGSNDQMYFLTAEQAFKFIKTGQHTPAPATLQSLLSNK